jgi:hypothetical protein
MIDKQPILNSVNLAIDQSLASLNDDLTALMQSRVNEIIQEEFNSGYLTDRIQRGIVDFLSSVIDEDYKQILLARIANNTDQFVNTEFAKTLDNTRQTINHSLAALNVEMAATINSRIDQILHTELGQGQLNSKFDIGVVKFLSFLVDENYKQILLSRITQETDTFVATTFAKTLKESAITILGLNRKNVYGSDAEKNAPCHIKWKSVWSLFDKKRQKQYKELRKELKRNEKFEI